MNNMNITNNSILQLDDTTLQLNTHQEKDKSKNSMKQTPNHSLLKNTISPYQNTQNIVKVSSEAFFPLSPNTKYQKFTQKSKPSIAQNHFKKSLMKKRQKLSNQKTIEQTSFKGLTRTLINTQKDQVENKKNNNYGQVELKFENDNIRFEKDNQDLFQNDLTDLGAAKAKERICKFCQQRTNSNNQSDEKENFTIMQKYLIDQKNENDQQNNCKDLKIVENNNNNRIEDIVKICRCVKYCWSHKNCLINMTIQNKYKCKQCNTIATFKTKKNGDWKILCKNLKLKAKQFLHVFLLFLISIIAFSTVLTYFIYNEVFDEDSSDRIIYIFSLAILFILLMHGFVFLWNTIVDKLSITIIDSDIKLNILKVIKKDNQSKKTSINEGQNQICHGEFLQKQKLEQMLILNLNPQKYQTKRISSPNSDFSQEQVKLFQKRNSSHCSNKNNNTVLNNSIQYKVPIIIKHLNSNQIKSNEKQNSSSNQYPKSYQRTLYNSEESEQSPYENKIYYSFKPTQQENTSNCLKNPSTSNSSKQNSNELKKNYSSLNKRHKQQKVSHIQKLKAIQQQHLLHQNQTNLNLNPKSLSFENESSFQNESFFQNRNIPMYGSPSTSQINMQQLKLEQTSRFGFNNLGVNSSNKTKKRNISSQQIQQEMLQPLKIDSKWKKSIFKNINQLSNQFNQNTSHITYINEECDLQDQISNNNHPEYNMNTDDQFFKPQQLCNSIQSSTNKNIRMLEHQQIEDTYKKQISS